MDNYKNPSNNSFIGHLKKPWLSRSNGTENQSEDLLCPNSLSVLFIQMMKNGESPLTEIQNNFDEGIPIFDDDFFRGLDHFIINQQDEGIKLLEFLLVENIHNTANFYGKHSIPIILDNLPACLQILACLLSQRLSSNTSDIFNCTDWISPLMPFVSNPDYHIILSNIFNSIEPLKINEDIAPLFYGASDVLLKSPIKESIFNILYGFQDHFFDQFQTEISQLLTQNFDNLLSIVEDEADEDESQLNEAIIQHLLLSFSKIVTDDTIEIIVSDIDSLFNFIFHSLSSDNESIAYAASELVSSLVSFEQVYEVLTSSDSLDLIFELALDSPIRIKNNMISILCDLILQQNTEQNRELLSRGILVLLFDFLDGDQSENVFEAVEGIQYLIDSFEETDDIDSVVDMVIENESLLHHLEEYQNEKISKRVEIILNKISDYMV